MPHVYGNRANTQAPADHITAPKRHDAFMSLDMTPNATDDVTHNGVTFSLTDTSSANFRKFEEAFGAAVTNVFREVSQNDGVAVLTARLQNILPAAARTNPALSTFSANYTRWVYEQLNNPKTSELDALMAAHPAGQMPATEVAKARALINALEPEQQADYFLRLQAKSQYASQRDNASRSYGGGGGTRANQDNMCNLNSLAMMLQYLGHANPNPGEYPQFEDYLEARRIERRYGDRRTIATMSKLAGDFGVAGFAEIASWRSVKRGDWQKWRDSHLAAGKSILILINGKQGGHYVRLQGVTRDGLIVDDPYGVATLGRGARRSWAAYNGKGASEGEASRRGEDNLWAWSQVEKHTFKGVWSLG